MNTSTLERRGEFIGLAEYFGGKPRQFHNVTSSAVMMHHLTPVARVFEGRFCLAKWVYLTPYTVCNFTLGKRCAGTGSKVKLGRLKK